MFGPSMLVSPVTSPTHGGVAEHLVNKTTWLPDGRWYNTLSGRVDVAQGGETMVNGAYALDEVPVWVRAGAVVPYTPLRSMPSTAGVASRQYGFLGWRVYPGAASGEGYAYEDDGETTDYLNGAWMNTTCSYDGGHVPASRLGEVRMVAGTRFLTGTRLRPTGRSL